jgi:phosphate acyltransferase
MNRIALDAMGGDFAPEAPIAAAARFSLKPNTDCLFLVGDQKQIEEGLEKREHDSKKIEIVHTPNWVAMDATPKLALQKYPDASITLTAQLVRDNKAQAMVSAGNTGAVVLACSQNIQRLPGVQRCALGAVYPTQKRRGEKDDPFSLILDAGLTVQADAQTLKGFAIMGAAYAKCISANQRPRVALLSNGTEKSKGPPSIVEAHNLLDTYAQKMPGFEFLGNIEGLDIPIGTADVVVTDGFTGNIVLKMLEGVVETVRELARYAQRKNVAYKAGLALLYPAVKELKSLTDWQQYGGAPLLGFDAICIKAHGRSQERALYNALKVARKSVEQDLLGAISRQL